MKNICLNILHYKTLFLHPLSIELERLKINVFWISPSPYWTKWLLSKGIKETRILNLTPATHKGLLTSEQFEEEKTHLYQLEQNSNYTINNMVLSDRLLREKSQDFIEMYLVNLNYLIRNFLLESKIDVVLGEPTPANELLTTLICKDLNIPYLFPFTVRIPGDRFTFFLGRDQTKIKETKDITEKNLIWAKSYMKEFHVKKPKPWYFETNNIKPKFSFKLIVKFFKNIKDDYIYKELDQTRLSLQWLIKKRSSEIFNRYMLDIYDPFIKNPNLDIKFVLFPLHKQPESSIDVLGDFVSNQLILIENISRSLPTGYKLYVKEHSNAIGDRPKSFYKKLSKIPSVVLISPYLDGFKLIKKSSLVMSISGTMAYEAGLIGKGTITFSEMYFNDLPNVNFCSDIHQLQNMIYQSLDYNYTEADENVIVSFLAKLHANSYSGYFQDPISTPMAINDSNIKNVAISISTFVANDIK